MIKSGHTRERQPEYGRRNIFYFFWVLAAVFLFLSSAIKVQGAEPVKVEFYYENVCASCEGDGDFYKLYNKCISQEEKEALNVEISTYNVFLDSCKERYGETAKRLSIPEETSLPVLVIGEQWMSGYDQMEKSLYSVLVDQKVVKPKNNNTEKAEEEELQIGTILEEIENSENGALLLFTTQSCEDCEQVKLWLEENRDNFKGKILEYNIIEDNCLGILKCMFREYGVEEKAQKVPALFYGDKAGTGKNEITSLDIKELSGGAESAKLSEKVKKAEKHIIQESTSGDEAKDGVNLLTLAGAGLLAGLNPCSISMLLMLLSLIISEKASVLKNGLLYLGGKYAAYIAIGVLIFLTASQIDGQVLEGAGRIVNGVLVVLFGAAGILYLIDAVRIFRQDYGKIRTQLPVGLRRWNHNLIRKAGGYSGILQPLLILGLGIAVSLGEFFCTGQIYMAAITYMLKDQLSGVWLPFLVYVTAMSLPAFLMIAVIQKTRNTEYVSEFMLRHLGAIKIFNAVLFFGFVVYFILQ